MSVDEQHDYKETPPCDDTRSGRHDTDSSTQSKRPVGSGTGAVIRRPLLGCIRGFPLRARIEVAVIPSPVPAASHAACGFAALRAPAPFTSRVMRPCAASLVDGVDEQTSESRLRDQYRSPKRIVRSLDRLHLDPVVLRRSENRFQRWAIRAIAAFLAVYMLGTAGIPTLVPYPRGAPRGDRGRREADSPASKGLGL